MPRSVRLVRSSVRLTSLLVAVLGLGLLSLTVLPPMARAEVVAAPIVYQAPDTITARLGISPGDANQGLALGSDRRVLERALPELFETAMALGVRIDTVSVGRGFFPGDDGVESETDLDLVVTGSRSNVLALGAILGQRWGQSVVLVWELRPDGEMVIASGSLPGGADKIDEATFQAVAKELPDGGHFKYAGADSLLVVANTGNVGEEEFRARLGRAQRILEAAGIRTGNLTLAWATMVELNRENYQRFIGGAVRSTPAQATPGPARPAQVPR
jgi:hypothetical protein